MVRCPTCREVAVYKEHEGEYAIYRCQNERCGATNFYLKDAGGARKEGE